MAGALGDEFHIGEAYAYGVDPDEHLVVLGTPTGSSSGPSLPKFSTPASRIRQARFFLVGGNPDSCMYPGCRSPVLHRQGSGRGRPRLLLFYRISSNTSRAGGSWYCQALSQLVELSETMDPRGLPKCTTMILTLMTKLTGRQ